MGLQPHPAVTLFVSIDFNESFGSTLTLMLGVNGPVYVPDFQFSEATVEIPYLPKF